MLSRGLGLISIGYEKMLNVAKLRDDSLRKNALRAMNKMIGWPLKSTGGKIG